MVGGRARRLARDTGRRGGRPGAGRRRGSAAYPGSGPGRGRRRGVRTGASIPLRALPRGGRGMSSVPTDRGTWRLVARRDFWVRIRERSFLISTLINIAVISILVLARAPSAVGSGPAFRLASLCPSPNATVAG